MGDRRCIPWTTKINEMVYTDSPEVSTIDQMPAVKCEALPYTAGEVEAMLWGLSAKPTDFETVW